MNTNTVVRQSAVLPYYISELAQPKHEVDLRMKGPVKTRSETLFEQFLSENHLSYIREPVEAYVRTPDYCVAVGDLAVIFEVKEIVGAWDNEVHAGVVGERIRQKINRGKRQMQSKSQEGKPTVLLIFNNYDPLQLFGTEDCDFEHAMYGENTLRLHRGTIVDRLHGRRDSMQVNKNTSISALGRLQGGIGDVPVTVTLFENLYAAVPLDYASLPPCFKVTRFLMI